VVFYCHFPDLLLAHHTTVLRRLYRKPIDFVEEITTGLFPIYLLFFFFRKYLFSVNFVPVEPTNSHLLLLGTAGMADMILVNSKFTASTFANTFKRLHARGIRPAVLYPAVNVDQFDEPHSYK
jgi:alpha-1,3/alpha-1,6-mannosyltransferase